MQKDQSDLGLIFKKRARRRLVGAVALVVLMVILLPMVLEDRAENDATEEIEIIMPTNALNEMQGATVEPLPKTEVVALPEIEEKVIELSPSQLKKTVEPAVEKTPEPAVTVKPKPKAAVKPAAEKLADKQVEAETPTGKFYVQIGVFSNMANVTKLQAKLDELGYQSVTEKLTTETGDKTRLRTINFDGRNEAAIALENIKDAGLTGMVVSQK